MNSNKLTHLKKMIEHKLSSFDFEGEIEKYNKRLGKILQTLADEYSDSGNIECGIDNILVAASAVNYPLGYLRSKFVTYLRDSKCFCCLSRCGYGSFLILSTY